MKNRKRFGCWMGLVLLCLCACGQKSDIYLEEGKENTLETEIDTESIAQVEDVKDAASEMKSEACYIYICGAVMRPGVYELPEGSRIYEVIEEAGGLMEDADDTLVNQAECVTDGMMIRIYTQDEAEELESIYEDAANESGMSDGRIDINSASVSELMTLPGIGSAKAEAIVSYREENGGFSSIEDLMKISGIKEGIFQQMKEHIKVNN